MNLNPDQSPQAVQPPSTPPPVETVVPPQNSTPPPAQKPSLFANKFVIIGIVLLFLIPIILAFGYFFVVQKKANSQPTPVPTVIPITSPTETPTPTPSVDTSNWVTYTSTQSAFLIKYPKENFVRLGCPGEDLVLKTRQPADTKDVENFETCGRDGRFTIEAFAAASLTEPTGDDFFAVEKSTITVAGVTAKKYVTTKKPTNEGPGPDWSEDIYFNHNAKSYMIHFDKSVTEDIKTAMLGTFQFTD